MNTELLYLASPYSHPSEEVRYERYRAAIDATAHLIERGLIVYSAIVNSHQIAWYGSLPTHWEYWYEIDTVILRRCDRLLVLCIDGWQESQGIAGEIDIARGMPIPVQYSYWCGGDAEHELEIFDMEQRH